MNGILLINKPENLTSFSALDRIRKKHRLKKIGHAGTIDSFATGLLIAGVGEGTKLLPYLTDRQKEYAATFHLGRITETLDPTGETVYEHSGKLPAIDEIDAALREFVGEIYQTPPIFSAVKICGERASDLARRGKVVELEQRNVTIYSAEINGYDAPCLRVTVRCSKGTYIRSLARDLGQRLGCGAYVSVLARTCIDPFSVNEAHPLAELLEQRIEDAIIPLEKSLPFMPLIEISENDRNNLVQGRIILLDDNVACGRYMAVTGTKLVGILKAIQRDGAKLGMTERIVWA